MFSQACRPVWAKFYVRFAELMKKKGVSLWGFTVQNEPDGQTPWENCLYSPQEERDFIRDHLGPELEKSGLDLKLIAWDHNRDDLFLRAHTIYSDPEASKYVWGMGWHWYGDPRYEWWPDPAGQSCFDNVRKTHELRPENLGVAAKDWNFLLNKDGGPNHVGNVCSAPILADRPGDCGQVGPATYVYRMSKMEPNDYFPKICPKLGGASVRFNNPCAWAHGQAQMTAAHFTNMCKGATRMIHWHTQADEWGFVSKGRLMTFVASPDGLPWPSSNNVLPPRGVWYFPSGWLHGLLCMTPEEEGGCRAIHSIHYSNTNMTAPIVTAVAPGECDPECPPVQETVGAPAAVQSIVEQKVVLPATEGVTLQYRIRTDQFPFARTMSQERTELAPGAVRPVVWTTAATELQGRTGWESRVDQMQSSGGILGNESHLEFANETLHAGDVAYFPNQRAYWFREATGEKPAETINVFDVGIWKSIELRQAVSEMPRIVVMSNLHQAHFARRQKSQ
eukprot:Skav204709  [mRNA]  locus=scaffold3332:148085:165810:- [translate_table: standard]